MSSTMVVKIVAAAMSILSILALALTGKVPGADALHAVQWITMVFLGGSAALGGMQAIAKSNTTTTPPAYLRPTEGPTYGRKIP